jgi:uncharacterized membrane protein YcfT
MSPLSASNAVAFPPTPGGGTGFAPPVEGVLLMTWARTVDQLEVVLFSSLIAFFAVTVIATVVGALTYLLTREPAAPRSTAPTVMSNVKTDREHHAAETATAIAG